MFFQYFLHTIFLAQAFLITQKINISIIYLRWNAHKGTKVLSKTSHWIFSWSFSLYRSRTANTHAPICFLGKLPGARTRLWASKSSENENLIIYISRPIFFAISFSGKSWGLFVGWQDSISLIAPNISSNKQKLLTNIDQRDSKVLLLIVTCKFYEQV